MALDAIDPLELFPAWLESLANDAKSVCLGLVEPSLRSEQRLWLAGGINYLLKSVDLIPEGVEDLGYLDDAFVLRYVVREAYVVAPFAREELLDLTRMAREAEYVGNFLGEDSSRLDDYVSGLRIAKVRGRSPSDIGEDVALASQVAAEVDEWAAGYQVPTFPKDQRSLVKLRSFLGTKLA